MGGEEKGMVRTEQNRRGGEEKGMVRTEEKRRGEKRRRREWSEGGEGRELKTDGVITEKEKKKC